MCVCAVSVESYPACFKSSSVEFRASARVNPDRLSPNGDTREIGFGAIELFVGCDVVGESFGGRAVLQPDRVAKCFSPEVLGEI